MEVRDATVEDWPVLVDVWRSAVDATHDFLAADDRDRIESHLASDYFPQVRLAAAVVSDRIVGFAGVAGGSLEMLFVHADFRGRGVGTTLLGWALRQGVDRVDVNQQNPQAVGFYLANGFHTVGRSDLDDQGRPYPLLRMALVSAPRSDR
ncbi:acetyltransferase [Tessaracoccus aquimaris]|uniref:Acetyltransferase n=1 Tax=Tessaracoccus aquimaris TaxID=1332264 RepID=A0A1Q2CP72_9ACTN|nr:acetyltransferase [Tessaracoccus aquimaris]AQP47894.1 acetyltransferase [Tessaracoccus aquimaris]